MHTATVEEMQSDSISLLTRVKAGEEVVITQRGKPVARIIQEKPAAERNVDWSTAPEVTRDRSREKMLTAQESLDLIHDAAEKEYQIPSPNWHDHILAERERLIASGEEQFMDWEIAKKQLREELV